MSNGNNPQPPQPHDLNRFTQANEDTKRSAAHQAAERGLIGERRHNIGGVAKSGALQSRRLGGSIFNGLIVGP